jgi:glycosyltransferase involved in cell wall biosynthesis
MAGISVVVCTYNPDKFIFERVLNAISNCELTPGLDFECLLIDNQSTPSLIGEEYIEKILQSIKGSRVIVENRQGLTWARRRGIQEAAFSHILFIDDDNEIDKDYIVQAQNLINNNPKLAAVNAGTIRVKYLGEVGEWFEKEGKEHFQESDIQETITGNDSKTFSHWPFGTGLMVSKEVCDYYIEKLDKGLYTLTDRNGKVLMSGGDGQLVACAIEMGYHIGRAKELKLNHLIAARKATIDYLTKIDYGIYFSGELFTKESLPENRSTFSSLQEIKLITQTYVFGGCRAILNNNFKKFALQRAALLGRLNGNRHASGKKSSWLLNRLSKKYIT